MGGGGGVREEKCSPTSKKETLVIAITQIMRGYAGKCLKSGPDQDKIGDSIEREEVFFFCFFFFCLLQLKGNLSDGVTYMSQTLSPTLQKQHG